MAVLDKPFLLRSSQERTLASRLAEHLEIPPQDFVTRLGEQLRIQAQPLLKELLRSRDIQGTIDSSRNIVGFNYWRRRCAAERTEDAIAAREHIFSARKLQQTGALLEPRDEYLKGFKRWRAVIDQFPPMLTDGTTAEEMLDEVKRYEDILKQLEESKPDDFPLQALIDENRYYYDLPR